MTSEGHINAPGGCFVLFFSFLSNISFIFSKFKLKLLKCADESNYLNDKCGSMEKLLKNVFLLAVANTGISICIVYKVSDYVFLS